MKQTSSPTMKVSIFYGLLCSLGFGIAAWGMDAAVLARHYAQVPYVKFLPAVLIAVLFGIVFAWVRTRTLSNLVKALTWIAYIALLIALAVWAPSKIAEWLVGVLKPDVAGTLRYSVVSFPTVIMVSFFIIVAVGVVAIFEENLSTNFLWSGRPIDKIKLILVAVLVMAMAGFWTDQIMTKELREPQVLLAKTFDFARQNFNTEVAAQTARAWHLSALRELGEAVLQQPAILPKSFEPGILEVFVDLNGSSAICNLIYGQLSRCVPEGQK